ncbi:DUF3147 family protein [Pelagicoccus sp. SDUM812002]|uniref:DUF3147 family protein n=1 Tax=Pelagicoccus sp. SDUM812002 TaxID=3041266 RepID=UPI0028105D0D|nr:DUF3147 family protein [Pelagicoccus sp. SDUM812002]MDQ8184570.1 DUF3147 family protein [Pelagicoccus sp. SDUM812002]
MIYFLTKVFTSAILIAVISEISKRSSIWAATLASLPLVSLLSIIWIYTEKKDTTQIFDLSKDIFWLVLPSLAFFILLPILLQRGLNFWPSLAFSSLATMAAYAITLKLIA